MMKCVLLCLVAVGALAFKHSDDAIDASIVAKVNSMNAGWTASEEQGSFFKGMNKRQVMGMMGVRMGGPQLQQTDVVEKPIDALPTNFVATDKWPNCPTIMQIRDQSACGSCWAMGAGETISDRYCTASSSPVTRSISAAWLMSCCSSCGMGCNGGFPSAALEYWVSHGLPTTTCDPYPFPKCEHHIPAGKYPKCPSNEYPTPKCNHTCADGSTPQFYKGSTSYGVSGESKLMNELYEYGSVEVAFTVYEDFLTYKSGVYKHTSGGALGGHAVKMIGWGETSSGEKYWVINNSWNEDWGNKGQFWILRGVDECGIESSGVAGRP
eukprot:NODE_2270_length_1099_cov_140.932099_g2252_i0.p2 GENE.NODE_2270_length_1099_cov_140.932099_g2252_i0~~NODE_2270_length_1099_cov_140.932099_g2252_i0.p2  ORF type:complete len:324 (+),score=86.20 NODE_2270_length_1099_cov_140.932099_g2252_i0:54-1025(+)